MHHCDRPTGTRRPANALWETTSQAQQASTEAREGFGRSSSDFFGTSSSNLRSQAFTTSFTSPEKEPGERGLRFKQRREALKRARARAEKKLAEKAIEKAEALAKAKLLAERKREQRRVKREKARLLYHLQVVAAETLQRVYRGHRARLRVEELNAQRREAACVLIQHMFFARQQRAFGRLIREQKLQEKILNIKVMLVQNCWRNFLARKDARSKLGAKKLAKEREERRERHRIQTGAAIRLQAYTRGKQSRMMTQKAIDDARNIDQMQVAKERLEKENGAKPATLGCDVKKGHAFMQRLGNKKVERRWKRKEDIKARKEVQEAEGNYFITMLESANEPPVDAWSLNKTWDESKRRWELGKQLKNGSR